MERRGHIRFYFSLSMEIQVLIPDSEEFWESRAILKNISQGGLYFECKNPPQVKLGTEGLFTFVTDPPKYSFINSPIKVHAVVKRIEARGDLFGVAVQFIAPPHFG